MRRTLLLLPILARLLQREMRRTVKVPLKSLAVKIEKHVHKEERAARLQMIQRVTKILFPVLHAPACGMVLAMHRPLVFAPNPSSQNTSLRAHNPNPILPLEGHTRFFGFGGFPGFAALFAPAFTPDLCQPVST